VQTEGSTSIGRMRGFSLWLVLLVAAACGGGGYQESCTADSECDSELRCTETFTDVGSSCAPGERICNKLCTSDGDCEGVSTLEVCGEDCTGRKVCS
jgi:hypothetical protein